MVIGFSMLTTFLIITEINFRQTVAIVLMATVLFFICLFFKKLRANGFLITALLSVVIFSLCYICAQREYIDISSGNMQREISGIVCETPENSDYAYSYVIKVKGEDYKIRYVTEQNRNFKQGEKVEGVVTLQKNEEESDYFESTLSSKIYFNCFEGSDCNLVRSGEKDPIYFYAGELKTWFLNVVSYYLSGENGGIAKAMSIGDRRDLSDKTTTMFNYSGISHLLVVSGLHLSLWSLGIIKIIQKKEEARKFVIPIGIFSILGFILLTGLSVSVIRAGLMVGFALLGKMFRRDSDSLNAIGFAVTIIMTSNPFSAYSAALWLSVLSTAGILVFYEPIKEWMLRFRLFKGFKKNSVLNFVLDSVSISLATAVCTMPVFIMKFNIMPIASIITNFLAVNVGLILMVSTVFGVFAHLFKFSLLADFLFFVVGISGSFLQMVAEKIGGWEYSTILVSSPIFKCFLLLLISCFIVAFALKRYKKNIFKGIVATLSILFVLIALYTTTDNYNTISIYVDNKAENVVTVVNYKGNTILVGNPDNKQIKNINDMMMSHNAKSLNEVVSMSEEIDLISSNFNVIDKNFNDYKVNKVEGGTEILCANVNLLLINDTYCENSFENSTKYDIIISNMQIDEGKSDLASLLQDENSVILCVQSGEAVNIDCKWENFYVTYN